MLVLVVNNLAEPLPTSQVDEITKTLASRGHAAVNFGEFPASVASQVVTRVDAFLEIGEGYVRDLIELGDRGVYLWPDVPPADLVEVAYPEQTHRFREELNRIYRQHLKKCADYSAANILVTGRMGVLVRVADKLMRLLTLAGFEVKIVEPARFEAPRAPNNESAEDSWRDLANYAVIDSLLRQGAWGR